MDLDLRKRILARKQAAGFGAVPVHQAITTKSTDSKLKNPQDGTERLKPFRWKPGQSGNPAGRPKNKSLEVVLRDYLAETSDADPDITRLEEVAKTLFSTGITDRNAKVMIAIFDRLWIKPVKIQGDPDNPITITHITRSIIHESQDSDA